MVSIVLTRTGTKVMLDRCLSVTGANTRIGSSFQRSNENRPRAI